MPVYLLLLLSILFASSNNLLLHKFSNRGLENRCDILLFNSLTSCVWIVVICMLGLAKGGFELTLGSVLWGGCYGVVIASFLLCKLQAMAKGPVSLTSFIGCSSLLVSTAFGVFVLKEGMSARQGIGVLILIIGLFLVVSPKVERAEKSWKLWCAAFLVCSAATGIIFKLHQRSESAALIDEMLLVAAIVASSVFALSALLMSRAVGRAPRVPKSALGFALSCGAVGCAYNRLNVMLTGKLDSVIFFPIFNGSVILISTLAGVFLFGERMKRGQLVGFALGVLSLILVA